MEHPQPPLLRFPKHQPSGGDLMLYGVRNMRLPWWVLRHAYATTTYPLGYVSKLRFRGQ